MLDFAAGCRTTAMGIMPHTDVDRAIDLALGLDIPFWPQLPNVSFYEDMYVQTSQSFPGIVVDIASEKISFDTARFQAELGDYTERMADPATFALSGEYASVYQRFLARDLSGYTAIRGQVTGPVSFGFRVTDENGRPIIYDDNVRGLLFDFIMRKANTQYAQLNEKNRNAFVWLDEPGLGWVFSGLSGYLDVQAKEDYQGFWSGFAGPKALHLCANVNLPYLLQMGIELLSFDAYQIELMPIGYATAVAEFIRKGGVIAWGIVPTDSENLGQETPETLARRLLDYWAVVSSHSGLPMEQTARQSLLAPARCCLKNIGRVGAREDADTCLTAASRDLTGEERLVETAFSHLKKLSAILKDKFGL